MTEKLVLTSAHIEYVNVGTGTLHIHMQMHSACMCGYFLHSSATLHPSRRINPPSVCLSCYRITHRQHPGWLAIESEVAG